MVKRYDAYGEDVIDPKLNNYLCKCYTYTKDRTKYESVFYLASDSKEEFLLEIAKYVCENQNDKIVTDILDLLVLDTCGSFLDSFGVGVENIGVTVEDIRGVVITYQEKFYS